MPSTPREKIDTYLTRVEKLLPTITSDSPTSTKFKKDVLARVNTLSRSITIPENDDEDDEEENRPPAAAAATAVQGDIKVRACVLHWQHWHIPQLETPSFSSARKIKQTSW